MLDPLRRIKSAVARGNIRFTTKAMIELMVDNLLEADAVESILNAESIHKRIRSTSPLRGSSKEYLYIIQSTTYSGLPVYTKGRLETVDDIDVFYVLVSSKRAL